MNLLTNELIQLDIDIATKEDLFRYLAKELLQQRRITSDTRFFNALMERETVISTGIGDGIAIPHAKDTTVIFPTLLVLRLNKPLPYESLDQQPVKLVFCIAMPEAYHKEHLQLLAKVSTSLMNVEHVKSLLNTTSKEDIINILGI
jgi:fructose-specific phosphotransferase system IIA component